MIQVMSKTALLLILALALAVAFGTYSGPAPAGIAAAPALYQNCTNLNKRYPHGLGRLDRSDLASLG